MQYEIHITVENNEDFIKTCEEIDVKPIIIVVDENKQESNQVMTSSKHNGTPWREVLLNLSKKLIDNKCKILRQKVEIYPNDIKSSNHKYYETHFRLKLKKDYDRTPLLHVCKYMKFHISRNLFKKNTEYDWLIITYRNNNMGLSKFKSTIYTMKGILDNMNIDYDKIEIEECIFDSNENIDNQWIKI